MDKRALMAVWLLPPAYALIYRVLAQLATRAIVAIDGSVYNQGLSLVIGIACAIASALLCVHVHLRSVGPLPVGRAFVMAAIAIPVLMLVHFFSMGVGPFTHFLMYTPVNAMLRYAIVFFALPIVAATWRRPARQADAYAGDSLPAQGFASSPAPASPGLVLLRVLVALVSAVTFVGYGLLYLFIWGMSGFGMGRSNASVITVASLPLPLLVFCFLSTTGLFGAGVLRIARPVVAVLTLPTLWFLVENGKEGAWIAVPVVGFVALWWLMCRRMEARAA